MLLANFNGKEHLRHRAVSLRQHGFLVLAFGRLIAVTITKFGRRSPLTGPQILERYCATLRSLCKGLILETVQDSYNSGPFKSKIVCPLALAVSFISLVTWKCLRQSKLTSTPTKGQTCRVLRREGWRSACCHQQCAAAAVCSLQCISATSVKDVMTRRLSTGPFASAT